MLRIVYFTTLLLTVSSLLSGCAIPVIAGLTLTELGSATSLASLVLTGKGLGEQALDLATGKDCRVVDALVREDRELCEPNGSPATEKDFKGLSGVVTTTATSLELEEARNEPGTFRGS